MKAAGIDADTLAKEGIILEPDAIESLSLVDPLTMVAFGGAFRIIGAGGKILATVPTVAKGVELTEKLGQFALNAAKKTKAKKAVKKTVRKATKIKSARK